MKGHIKDYFTFTKSERIGITILVLIIIIILILPRVIKNHTEAEISGDELYQAEVNEFLNGINSNQSEEEDEPFISGSNHQGSLTRFKPRLFDPNYASQEEWVEMGFTERQAATIIKYRSKGGIFHKKEDLNKLYVVDDDTYRIFEPYIRISDPVPGFDSRQTDNLTTVNELSIKKSKTENIEIDLNSADSVDLLKIKGVGPVFASRIIKYRKRLGGFNSIEQLQEVYGIDSTRFSQIASQVRIDSVKVIKINVNTVSIGELKKHPYLDYYLAKAIIDKRIQRGGYASLSDLKEVFNKKPGLFEKVSPYFTVSQNSTDN